jgi:hypothetical protein
MKELINISGQQFYYSTIDQVIEGCSGNKKCALIIDEQHWEELMSKGQNTIGECINQIIIISDNVNNAVKDLEGVGVMVIAAGSLNEAVRIAIFGAALSQEVYCIPNECEDNLGGIVSEMGV